MHGKQLITLNKGRQIQYWYHVFPRYDSFTHQRERKQTKKQTNKKITTITKTGKKMGRSIRAIPPSSLSFDLPIHTQSSVWSQNRPVKGDSITFRSGIFVR